MLDLELINKAAHRVYPTHLNEEAPASSFSWNAILPSAAKSTLKNSAGHKETSGRNSHTLTHKLKGGASIEFNVIGNGKNHIVMAKYQKGGKLFTAIHSHEDPHEAMSTVYHSIKKRMVTEEIESTLVEKMAKRIEKKTGKLSDKKEKIDVEPSEEKELKESTTDSQYIGGRKTNSFEEYKRLIKKHHPDAIQSDDSSAEGITQHHIGLGHVVGYFDHKYNHGEVKPGKQLKESTPPGMESWVKKNKANFVKEYGEKKGHEVLYATAWKLHNKMNEMEELNELSKKTLASYIKKASTASLVNGWFAGWRQAEGQHAAAKKDGAIARKRDTGIKKAAGKLTEEELNEAAIGNTVKLQSGQHLHVTGFKLAKGTKLGSVPGVGVAPLPGSKVTHYIGHLGSTPYEARRGSQKVEIPIEHVQKGSELNIMNQPVKRKNPLAKLSEDELNELSKKTLASYVKKSNHSSFELGYDAASNEFHDDGDYKKTQKDEKKALKRQRFVSKAIDKLAEAEYPTDTKQGILAQLDYHHGRENYHRQSAEMNHRKANKHALGSENYKLYKNVAKGQEAIAKHHHNRIQDLHKKFATINESEGKVEMMYLSKGFISPKLAEKLARESKHLGTDKSTGEQHYLHPQHGRMVLVPHKSGEFQFRLAEDVEQLDELSPHTLGRYIKFAAIDKSKHAAHGAISDMAMYNAQNRGDKKDAQREKELGDVHRKKATKRLNGIIKATNKLVRKTVVKEEQLEETRTALHPDKVVMTSSIRKDLGGGYMAKTRNGHFYKLDVNALGEPGKGRELPNLGTVLDISKHKFIGKNKVDLNLLKENLDHDHPDMKAYHAACKARDEAHLASIRYRMHHDIKQPEHRAKYDELEAEHHRLRDIEDAASEKVNGRLFAHHALKEQLISEAEEDHFKKVPEGLEWEPYSLRGYGSTEHGYKSKDGHWKLIPYHTTTYKKVKNTRLRDPGKTRYDFSVAVHNDGKWLGTKRFAGVTGEHNRDKIEAGKQKMTTALTKKIPNFNEFHVSH